MQLDGQPWGRWNDSRSLHSHPKAAQCFYNLASAAAEFLSTQVEGAFGGAKTRRPDSNRRFVNWLRRKKI
jgi:hypothetical protein